MNASVARAFAYALSAGAHVAIMAVSFGHPAPAASAQQLVAIPTEIAVDVVPVPEREETPEAPRPNEVRTGAPTPPTHTHPYPVAPDHDAHPHDPNLVHLPFAPHDDHDHDEHDHEPKPDAEPVADAPIAHFTMSMVTSGGTHGTPSSTRGDAHDAPDAHGESGAVGAPMAEGAVSVPARLLGAVTPAYPPSAREDDIEADVALEIIVAKDGQVVDAHVTRPAGHGFDDAAVRAVRVARFTPAQLHGVAVPVRMRWNVSFRLR